MITKSLRIWLYILSLMLVVLLAIFYRQLHPTAHFFISNNSEDRRMVDMILTMGGEKVFGDTIKYTSIRPDLSYTPELTLPKGKYLITITADSGKLQVKQRVMLDGDRYIFISYSYTAPLDTTKMASIPGFPYSDVWKEQKPKIEIYVTDEEPWHL